MILYKTAKAVEELAAAKRELPSVQRRALLLADGNRRLDDIKSGINRPDASELLYLLIRQGYLSQDPAAHQKLLAASPQPPAVLVAPAPKPAAEDPPPIDSESKNAIIVIMQQTSTIHLGLFAQDILRALDKAEDDKALRNCISRWHVAMIESRSGREVALDALQEIKSLLNGHGRSHETAAA